MARRLVVADASPLEDCITVIAPPIDCEDGWICTTENPFNGENVLMPILPNIPGFGYGGGGFSPPEPQEENIDALPDCSVLVYAVADAVSYTGIISGAISGWKLLSNPDAKLTIKLKKVLTISAKTIAKVSIVAAVAGETTKMYCKIAEGS